MTKFNVVNVYKHKSYFSRLISVKPAQALRLHALLMDKMNNVYQNRTQNKIKATPTDDADALGISDSTYQVYKKALLDAKIWTYDNKHKNNHRIAGDWHISEDLLDDPFSLVSSDKTRKDADVSSDEETSGSKKDDKNQSLVLPDKTRKDKKDDPLVSPDKTRKDADISSKIKDSENKKGAKNDSLVLPDNTRLVLSHKTYIYSIIDNINTIDDDEFNKFIQILKNCGFEFGYFGKVLKQQKIRLKLLLNQLSSKDRKEIFDKLIYSNEKPTKDTLNWLIRSAENQLNKKRKKPKFRNIRKVEKGTDWSKKKVDTDSGMSTEQLRRIYSKL